MTEVCSDTSTQYPLIAMEVNGTLRWLPLEQAAQAYVAPLTPVEIGGKVIEALGASPRDLTRAERAQISALSSTFDGDI